MPRLIDYHHHIFPTGRDQEGYDWSPAKSVDALENAGIDFAFASLGPVQRNETESVWRTVRDWNDFGARFQSDHKDKFGVLITLDWDNPQLAVAEIARGINELGCVGISATTRVSGRWIGDSHHDAILEILDDVRAMVFVHPSPAGPGDLGLVADYGRGELALPWLEFPVNTARALLHLLLNKVPQRFPNIRFVFCHGGGVVPLLVGRIEGFLAWKEVGQRRLDEMFPGGIATCLRHFYFEAAQTYHQPTFEFLLETIGADRLLFGSDFPYIDPVFAADAFRNLDLSAKACADIGSRSLERI